MNHKIDRDTYIIPPNFIESGTFFGGMFKARNVIEAGILAFAIGVPVFSLLPLGLTARIIALCLTALPAALLRGTQSLYRGERDQSDSERI